MQCLNVRRKVLNLKKGPTLTELFSNMTILFSKGRSRSSGARLSITNGEKNNYISASGTVYFLSACNGYIGIWKIIDRTIQQTPIVQMNSSYGGVVDVGSSSYYCMYYDGGYISGEYTLGTNVICGVIGLITFPSYTDEEVDKTLSRASFNSIVGANSSTATTLQTNDKTHKIYFAIRSSNNSTSNGWFDAWSCNGSSYTKLSGTGTAAASTSGQYLTLGSERGVGIIGID